MLTGAQKENCCVRGSQTKRPSFTLGCTEISHLLSVSWLVFFFFHWPVQQQQRRPRFLHLGSIGVSICHPLPNSQSLTLNKYKHLFFSSNDLNKKVHTHHMKRDRHKDPSGFQQHNRNSKETNKVKKKSSLINTRDNVGQTNATRRKSVCH